MKRLLSPSWLLRHVVMLAIVAVFLRLGWWQIMRASGGNGLSLGYSVEWPVFAGFVFFMWFREVRIVLRAERGTAAPGPAPDARPASVDETAGGVTAFDPAAAAAERTARTVIARGDGSHHAYNDYLAWLAANPGAKPSAYRGPAANPEKESSAR